MAEGSDAITGKFDFYDVLGYLIPGLVLIGLLLLPFGLIKGIWPSTDLTTAILYLVSAHIVGHVLHSLLRSWERVPQIKDANGRMRSPSSVFLDADHQSLAVVRMKIGELAARYWKISSGQLLTDDRDSDRNSVFLQARNLLLQSKKQSYFEQFQGKYALLGGMTVCLLLASEYYVGWAMALIPSHLIVFCQERAPYIFGVFLVFFVLYLTVVQILDGHIQFPRMILVLALAIGMALAGFLAASASWQPTETQKGDCSTSAVGCDARNSESANPSHASPGLHIEHKTMFMFILGLVAFAGAVRCYGGYKAFAREFAMGVWRDFANFDIVASNSNKE